MGTQGLLAKGPPAAPQWLLFVKIAIIVLSLIILALAAYAISLFAGVFVYAYGTGAPGYLIFLVVKTWIIYGLAIAFELKAPQFFFRVAFLIAYILSVIFWLSGWAWAASWAASILSIYGNYRGSDPVKTFGSVMGACAGLGAIVWILVIVNLVFFILACLRSSDSTGNVELGQQKTEQPQAAYGQPQQPVYGQPQQPAYGQPQQPAYGQPQQPQYGQQPGQPVYGQPQQAYPTQ